MDSIPTINSSDILPELYHLPCGQERAELDRRLNVEANLKIKQGFFKDKLLLVVAMPKSASSVIASTMASVIKKKRKYASYMLKNGDPDLRPELAKDFLDDGGVLKYHPRASTKNLKVIEILGIKYAFTIRHPLDHMAALLYHYEKSDLSQHGQFIDSIFPINLHEYRQLDLEEKLNYLISNGYLWGLLTWLSDWLYVRDTENSYVVKYEDFFSDDRTWLQDFIEFWGQSDIDHDFIKDIFRHADEYKTDAAQQSENAVKMWSGSVGIWEKCFSAQNKERFDSVIDAFKQHYPHAHLLLDYYPDLKSN